MLKELVIDNPRQSFTDSDISLLTERSYNSLKIGTKRSVVNFPRRRQAGSNAILISYKNSPLRFPYLATTGRRSPNASTPTFDELASSLISFLRCLLLLSPPRRANLDLKGISFLYIRAKTKYSKVEYAKLSW